MGDLTIGRAAPSASRFHLRKPDFKPTSRCAGPTRECGGTIGLRMSSFVNLSWLSPIFAQASERLNLGELAGGATVWLAVTGLSRSGKTVFITSLIHNLLSCAHNPNRMPLLGVVGERRLIAATIAGASANRLPSFPYRDNIEKMAVPDWPAPTEGMSEVGIEVRFAPASALGRFVSA